MKNNLETVVANVGCFSSFVFLGKCCITEDKMDKNNREVKELRTKQNLESWLQHMD